MTEGSTLTERGTMAGNFEIFRDRGGGYRFRLKAGNGKVIGTSERYNAERACANGIQSLAKHAPEGATAVLTVAT